MKTILLSLLVTLVVTGLTSYSGAHADSPAPTPTPTQFGVAGIKATDEELRLLEKLGLAGVEITPTPTVVSEVAGTTPVPTSTPYTGPPIITYEAMETDGDGCPDGFEGGENSSQGGERDATNPWDYFNPTHDGYNRVDDILAVVNHYFTSNPEYDRTFLGPNEWNLGPPNGRVQVDDILNQIKQYMHDCSPAEITIDVAQDCNDVLLEAEYVSGIRRGASHSEATPAKSSRYLSSMWNSALQPESASATVETFPALLEQAHGTRKAHTVGTECCSQP